VSGIIRVHVRDSIIQPWPSVHAPGAPDIVNHGVGESTIQSTVARHPSIGAMRIVALTIGVVAAHGGEQDNDQRGMKHTSKQMPAKSPVEGCGHRFGPLHTVTRLGAD